MNMVNVGKGKSRLLTDQAVRINFQTSVPSPTRYPGFPPSTRDKYQNDASLTLNKVSYKCPSIS